MSEISEVSNISDISNISGSSGSSDSSGLLAPNTNSINNINDENNVQNNKNSISKTPKFERGKSYCVVAHNIQLGKRFISKYIKTSIENAMIIEPEDNIGIDEIRQVAEFLKFRLQGDNKVIVIYEADKMTQEAANAFLKTLEEPPPYSIIVLVTSKYSSLLPTIKSRVQKITVTFPELPEHLSDFERHIVFWNFDFLERILNKEYEILDINDLNDEKLDKLSAAFTLKVLVEKHIDVSFKEYVKFVSAISKINNFSFLKLFAKVLAWFFYTNQSLKNDEKFYYLKICDEIERSKIGNFNYQLTYYTLLLGLRGENI